MFLATGDLENYAATQQSNGEFVPPNEAGTLSILARSYAKKLIGQYQMNHHKYIKDGTNLGFNTVYVSLKLKEFIECLQRLYKNGDGSTICRIYFGAHDGQEKINGIDVSNKMTLIFVGAKVVGDCIVEQIDNTTMPGYDFGTLCPPQCAVCCEDDNSLASEIYPGQLCPFHLP